MAVATFLRVDFPLRRMAHWYQCGPGQVALASIEIPIKETSIMSEKVTIQPEIVKETEKKLVTLKKLDTQKAKLLIGGVNRC